MLEKLKLVEEKLMEIEKALAAEDLYSDPAAAAKLLKEQKTDLRYFTTARPALAEVIAVNTAIAIAIFSVPSIARMVRGIVMANKGAEYIQACQVMGASHSRIIFTHIIPNAVSQIIVNITLNLGTAILTASSLSFLGLGVQPPDPEWGAMLSTGRDVIRAYPLAVFIPGIAVTMVVMSFSLVGDGLRDALDPKLKNG